MAATSRRVSPDHAAFGSLSVSEIMISKCQNRRKSELRTLQNRFLVCFSHFRVSKFRFLIANRRSVSGDFAVSCHPVVVYVEARDYTSAETTGRKSTECDRKSTNIDRNATEMRPNATLLRHFVQVANSGLRRIACDFLTSRIRVGCEPKAHGRPSVGTSSDFVEADVPFDPAHVTFFGVPRVVKKAHLGPNLFEEFHLGSPTDGSGISRAARA